MKNKVEVYNIVNYEQVAICYINYILPIGTHFIIHNTEFIILDYVIMDYDFNTLKMIVKKVSNNERNYLGKIL